MKLRGRSPGGNRRLWAVRRLLLGVVVLLVSILVFLATQVLPGDAARAALGLDRPLLEQCFSWLGGILTGDFGHSLVTRGQVSALIGGRVVDSAALVLLSAVIVAPPSVAAGALSGRWRDRPADRAKLVITLGLTALPRFERGGWIIPFFANVGNARNLKNAGWPKNDYSGRTFGNAHFGQVCLTS